MINSANGETMKQINIEDDLYKYILANIEEFGETPSQILRRLLQLPTNITQPEVEQLGKAKSIEAPVAIVEMPIEKAAEPRGIENLSFAGSSVPEALSKGISALFDSEVFQTESVITNKFKMMLTAMYYENRTAFIEAAKVAKGRSRDYLGENLEQLLASSNQEEVDLLIASKPRDIPYTPFWVVTNANTGRKRIILTQVMASMGYPHHLIERIKQEI